MITGSIAPYVGLIKDTAAIIFYIVASGGAVFGLRTWKLQLIGEAKLEVYRELIRTVYRIQDLISSVRKNNGFDLYSIGVDHTEKYTQESIDNISKSIIKAKELAFELKVIDKSMDYKCVDVLLEFAEDFKTSITKYRAINKYRYVGKIPEDVRTSLISKLEVKVRFKGETDPYGEQLNDVVSKIESSISQKIKL